MEGLLELLPLLFIAVYYLLRARRRAAEQRQARRPAPQEPLIGETEARELTPFQQFLQQFEDTMAEAVGDPATREVDQPIEVEKTRAPSPLPSPPVKPVRPTPEFHAPTGSFDAARPASHERHGFGAQNPLSEETFERQPAQVPPRPGPRPPYDPHNLGNQTARLPQGRASVSYWRQRLADPAAAREAFVLQTIFGERGGRFFESRQ